MLVIRVVDAAAGGEQGHDGDADERNKANDEELGRLGGSQYVVAEVNCMRMYSQT